MTPSINIVKNSSSKAIPFGWSGSRSWSLVFGWISGALGQGGHVVIRKMVRENVLRPGQDIIVAKIIAKLFSQDLKMNQKRDDAIASRLSQSTGLSTHPSWYQKCCSCYPDIYLSLFCEGTGSRRRCITCYTYSKFKQRPRSLSPSVAWQLWVQYFQSTWTQCSKWQIEKQHTLPPYRRNVPIRIRQ